MFSKKCISLDVSFPTMIRPSTEPQKRSFLFKIQKREQCTQKHQKTETKKQAKGKAVFHLEDSLVGWLFIAIAGLADKCEAVQK